MPVRVRRGTVMASIHIHSHHHSVRRHDSGIDIHNHLQKKEGTEEQAAELVIQTGQKKSSGAEHLRLSFFYIFP